MKGTLVTVIILTVIIVAIGVATAIISANVSQDFIAELQLAEESIQKEDWVAARYAVKDMAGRWEETCEWLQFWVNHRDTDEVNLGLEHLAAALKAENKSLSLWAAAELNESLGHIEHRDSLRIGNIL